MRTSKKEMILRTAIDYIGEYSLETLSYDSLAEASENLSSLLEDLQNNPKRYVHFSLFGGGKNK